MPPVRPYLGGSTAKLTVGQTGLGSSFGWNNLYYGHDQLKITVISRIGFEPKDFTLLDRESICRPPHSIQVLLVTIHSPNTKNGDEKY